MHQREVIYDLLEASYSLLLDVEYACGRVLLLVVVRQDVTCLGQVQVLQCWLHLVLMTSLIGLLFRNNMLSV